MESQQTLLFSNGLHVMGFYANDQVLGEKLPLVAFS